MLRNSSEGVKVEEPVVTVEEAPEAAETVTNSVASNDSKIETEFSSAKVNSGKSDTPANDSSSVSDSEENASNEILNRFYNSLFASEESKFNEMLDLMFKSPELISRAIDLNLYQAHIKKIKDELVELSADKEKIVSQIIQLSHDLRSVESSIQATKQHIEYDEKLEAQEQLNLNAAAAKLGIGQFSIFSKLGVPTTNTGLPKNDEVRNDEQSSFKPSSFGNW